VEHLKAAPLGEALALLANIRLSWKGFGRNKHSSLFGLYLVMKKKSFIKIKMLENFLFFVTDAQDK
jgi:hypothetical protein